MIRRHHAKRRRIRSHRRRGGGDRAAFMCTLLVSCKMNDVDPQAWMADVLARLPDMPVSRVHELLPWHWKAATELKRIAA